MPKKRRTVVIEIIFNVHFRKQNKFSVCFLKFDDRHMYARTRTPQLSHAESIECKNEMDPFPKLIDLIFTEQMYLN